jgi:predicted TIM-barrel fold metal-dependent hydrolase
VRGNYAYALAICLLPVVLPAQETPRPTFGTTVVIPSGLKGQVYLLRRNADRLPDFDKLKEPAGNIYTSELNIPPQDFKQGFPGVTDRFEWFAIDYTGRFWIEKSGIYAFALLSDDGSRLSIDDQLLIDNDGVHPPQERRGSVRLSRGIHRIRVSYFQGPRFEVALVLRIAGPGEKSRVFSTEEFKPPSNPENWPETETAAVIKQPQPQPQPQPVPEPDDLSAEIAKIRAIDNHAHPVRVTASGEKPDHDFDALPVDSMEPQSDPVNLRPGAPAMPRAAKALAGKQQALREKGAQYPAWVLDQMGVDVMLANRVEMGTSIEPPRFLWVTYADALIFPLDNSRLAAANPDRKAFFALEDALRKRYMSALGLKTLPATLSEYLARVVTPLLERQRSGGAVAVKFEAAYLRSLEFNRVERGVADAIYARYALKGAATAADYKQLQDFLFRYIAAECGRLGMAVHLHTCAGAGGYFSVSGANPLLLEIVLNDPELRKTKFVMLHGGWPFTREITALLTKPNAWLDFSGLDLTLQPEALAGILREWLEYVPEKVLFATDAYPYSPEMGWEEAGWIGSHAGRQALAIALNGMLRSGEITRERALQLARMVLRDNARALYGLNEEGKPIR